MELPFHTLDVFTARRFGGNPLAVVLEADGLTTVQMQTVAREFNLSETIFVQRPENPANSAKVRIFFPTAEIPFAGHPTVGCAILLAEMKNKAGCSFETEIRLEEQAGLVPVKVTRIGDVPRAEFVAPVIPHAAPGVAPDFALAARALDLTTAEIGLPGHALAVWQGGPAFLYIPVASRTALARARPIEPHWSQMIAAAKVNCAYLYTPGGDHAETAFRARMFAPTAGTPEDPATGSATAILSAQLFASGLIRPGTTPFRLEQGYEMGRPSDLFLTIDASAQGLTAVRVAGQAVRVSRGVLEI